MVAASSSSMALADKRRQIYKYDCLVHVKKGQPGPYNVFGVVKFSKVPVKSRGTGNDYNNNNNVHLSRAHQRPEHSHNMY